MARWLGKILARQPVAGNQFYADPAGGSTNSGAIGSPWDLQTALDGGYPAATVQPGDTVWMRGGTYAGKFTTSVSGVVGSGIDDPGGKIHFRSYSGEWAVLDSGASPSGSNGILSISSNYCWFRDFEIRGSQTSRTTTTPGSFPPDILMGGCIETNTGWGIGCKVIQIYGHDGSGGVSLWADSANSEAYGCIFYNIGWKGPDRGHGHCNYSQNTSGTKRFTANMFWGSADVNVQLYGSSAADINNVTLYANVMFNNGGLGFTNGTSSYASPLIFGTGSTVGTNAVVDRNAVYDPASGGLARALNLGYNGGLQPCQFTNNYVAILDNGFFAAQFRLTLQPPVWDSAATYPIDWIVYSAGDAWKSLQNGNTNNAVTPGVWWTDLGAAILDSNLTMTGNSFYGRLLDDDSSYGNPTIPTRFATNTYYDLTPPATNYIQVDPVNRYETGRGHVTVFNWQNLTTVNADISSFMPNGANWAAYNAQNPLGSAVATGTNYAGGTITLPMTAGGGMSVVAPLALGSLTACNASYPEFAAFIIRKTN